MTANGSHLDAAPARVVFALVVADAREGDDVDAISLLATELRAILDTANRAAAAARGIKAPPHPEGHGALSRASAQGPWRCLACSGLGAAIGQCADCGGAGSVP